MDTPHSQPGVSRRSFLYASGLAAGSAVLTSCSGKSNSGAGSQHSSGSDSAKGSAPKPLSPPKNFQEAPDLAKQVKAGKLPKVEKRLPKHPYVVPHRWLEQGKYGGILNMGVVSSQGTSAATGPNGEFFYGFSPLRFLNDGDDIGPGTVDKWSSNDKATEWTLHFREGLRWSDGHKFSVDDVLFWWEDIAVPGHFSQAPPEWCKSGSGKLVKISKVDDLTLKMTYDTPAPMLPTYLATWPNGGKGDNGAIWVLPKHYLKQFHPKYGKKVPKDWDKVGGLWEKKSSWMRNPHCPVLSGYRCKSYDSGKGVVYERNPYYYAVTKDGDQLPYIDEISIQTMGKRQVQKLQIQQGKIDFAHAKNAGVTLDDVSTLSKYKDKADIGIRQWNSGSGTGSLFMLNYDYPDKELRKLFREPKFRQAISHAVDRKAIQKKLWYTTGELTTGTVSPVTREFEKSEGKKLYTKWRDSYKEHDPEKAKKLLSELGLKDGDGDGYVELPSGKKLTVRIDYAADMQDLDAGHDDQLVKDCKKIGLHMKRNPVSPQSFGDQWGEGKLMVRTGWDVGDGVSLFLGDVWLAPLEEGRWAPLEGQYYKLAGTKKAKKGINESNPWKSKPPRVKPDPDGPVAKLQSTMDKAQVEPDDTKRHQLLWDILKIHVEEGPFFMGYVANPANVEVVKNGLKNVPEKENLSRGGLGNPWTHPTPAVYDPEAWFWDHPKKHS